MPDTATGAVGLLAELREKIKDTSWTLAQFSIRVSGSGVSSAVLEIEENQFTVTVVGGSAPSVDLSTTSTSYNTIEKLTAYLRTLTGYEVTLTESGDPRHPTTDLYVQAPISILNATYQVRTRRWSDAELTNLLTDALRRHNISVPQLAQLHYTGDYTLETVPEPHKYFIVLLGQIEMLKTLISDASKRRGTDISVADYVAWKASLELEYESSLEKLIAAVEAIPPAVLTEEDQGDVVIGHSYRTRFGARWPHNAPVVPASLAPMPRPSTLTAIPEDDGLVLLEWSRNRDMQFERYEVWRGTTDEVSNKSRAVTPVGTLDFDGTLVHTQGVQYRTTFIDGTMVPLTAGTYYYRIYTYSRNGDSVSSQAVAVTVV